MTGHMAWHDNCEVWDLDIYNEVEWMMSKLGSGWALGEWCGAVSMGVSE